MPREKLQELPLLCVTNGSPYLADRCESDRYIPFNSFNVHIDLLLKNEREYYYTKICRNINENRKFLQISFIISTFACKTQGVHTHHFPFIPITLATIPKISTTVHLVQNFQGLTRLTK